MCKNKPINAQLFISQLFHDPNPSFKEVPPKSTQKHFLILKRVQKLLVGAPPTMLNPKNRELLFHWFLYDGSEFSRKMTNKNHKSSAARKRRGALERQKRNNLHLFTLHRHF